MEAAMEDLLRFESDAVPEVWDYELLEITAVTRVDDMLDDWFVSGDDPGAPMFTSMAAEDDFVLPRHGTFVPALVLGSVAVASIGGVVAALL